MFSKSVYYLDLITSSMGLIFIFIGEIISNKSNFCQYRKTFFFVINPKEK
jgi:hypothetical protein